MTFDGHLGYILTNKPIAVGPHLLALRDSPDGRQTTGFGEIA